MKTCSKCGAEVNPETDMTLCGYGKCVTCCLGCMHTTHYNRNNPEGKKADDMRAINHNRQSFQQIMNGIKV